MPEDFGVAEARLPTSDVLETEKELIVKLDAPGFDEKELSLEVSDHTLVMRGEKSETKDNEGAHFYVRERLDARFRAPVHAATGGGHEQGRGGLKRASSRCVSRRSSR